MMDIKDYIKLCTKIDKKQGVRNVKWSSVPKVQNQTPQQWNQSLPYHLQLDKYLHDEPEAKEHENKHDDEDEEFQVLEIRRSLREVGVGWDNVKSLEKRYKESQIKYTKAITDRGSSESFTSAQTTTNSVTEDSFSSTIKDFQHLQITDAKKDENVPSILQSTERHFPVGKRASTFCLTDENVSVKEKENPNKDENKMSIRDKKYHKVFKSKKSRQPMKDLIQKDSNQRDSVKKQIEATDKVSRKYYMGIPDERLFEFEIKKSKS